MSVDRAKLIEIAKMASELVRQGWCQGSAWEYDGEMFRYCMVGAAHQAAIDIVPSEDRIKDHNPFLTVIGGLLQAKTESFDLGEWNDAPERTHQEVIKIMESVAKLTENWE